MSHDIQLEEAVIAELGWEPSVVAPYIGVAASDGAVTLTGHVGTYMEKHGAEAAARRVRGVKAVIEITIIMIPDASPITVQPFGGLLHRVPRSQRF